MLCAVVSRRCRAVRPNLQIAAEKQEALFGAAKSISRGIRVEFEMRNRGSRQKVTKTVFLVGVHVTMIALTASIYGWTAVQPKTYDSP